MTGMKFRPTLRLTACTALAMSVAAMTMVAVPAEAALKHHRHVARMGKYARAHLRPGYVGAPGYVGGPTVATGPTPTMGGEPGLLGNGGLLGVGVLPQTGIFTGVPLLGNVGL